MLGSIIRLRRAKNRPALFSESHSRPGEAGSLEVPLRGSEEGRGIVAGPWAWGLRWGGGSRGKEIRGRDFSAVIKSGITTDKVALLLLCVFEESSRREEVERENEGINSK